MKWDNTIPLESLWEQYRRITKPDSPIILFGQGLFSARLMLSQSKMWRYNLVWQKDRVTGHLNANRMPLRQHEDILVFYKKQPVYHPQMSYKPGQKNHPRGMFKRMTNRCYGAMKPTPSRISDWKYPTSVIYMPKEFRTGMFYHPTQKPVALIEYLIRTYTDEGDVVLDNCIGSGTTAVAAIRSGRHYIGFETEQAYCEIAERRIREELERRNETKEEKGKIDCINHTLMKPSNYLKELYRNPTDEKYTPGYGVLPIIKYIPESKIIWCPFDTEHSEFVLKFKAAGFEVVYSHICKGQDFFEYEPPQWDVLVSNPPFSRKVDVFDRCLKFGKPFALLMSNYWLNNVAPCRLFLNTELELLMFDKRIQFGEGKNVPFNSSYFCHRILPKPIIFEQMYIADKSPSRMQEDLPETDGCQSARE